ncbi:MAG: 23S rRNA (uridine(2479)-2'-O)-methyltransferase [Nitrospira sp.]|nr:23S rRNA (uridine(2479)-2'-O)-methyltransferase [Nitrospira sp.]
MALPLLTRTQGSYIRELLQERRVRAAEGVFVVEGTHAVRDLLSGYPEQVRTIVTTPGYLLKEGRDDGFARLPASVQQYSCPDFQFSKLSDLEAPQGILAVVRQPAWDEAAILQQPMILGIFGEQLQDPVNVGAIIRTAAALNVCALWLTPESADIYHPKVVRSASGTLLALPIFFTKNGAGLIQHGCQIFTAEVGGPEVVSIDAIHQAPRKLVVAVGNESRGLSAQIRTQATTRFTIPLSRDVESLNVAATVAIATFYFSRLPKEK